MSRGGSGRENFRYLTANWGACVSRLTDGEGGGDRSGEESAVIHAPGVEAF